MQIDNRKTTLLIALALTLTTGLQAREVVPDRYWVNAAGDNAWSNAENWSATTGGPGGAGVPTVEDDVVFSGTVTDNCTVDQDVKVASIHLQQGYKGTVTQNKPASTTGAFTQDQGTWDVNAQLSIGGDYRLTGGHLAVVKDHKIVCGGSFTRTEDGFITWRELLLEMTGTGTLLLDPEQDTVGRMKIEHIIFASGCDVTVASAHLVRRSEHRADSIFRLTRGFQYTTYSPLALPAGAQILQTEHIHPGAHIAHGRYQITARGVSQMDGNMEAVIEIRFGHTAYLAPGTYNCPITAKPINANDRFAVVINPGNTTLKRSMVIAPHWKSSNSTSRLVLQDGAHLTAERNIRFLPGKGQAKLVLGGTSSLTIAGSLLCDCATGVYECSPASTITFTTPDSAEFDPAPNGGVHNLVMNGSGTLDITADRPLEIAGDFIIKQGTVTNSANADIAVGGKTDFAGGTFHKGEGTLTVKGAQGQSRNP